MNPSIKKLAEIAGKQTRTIIGLMSGTSLDGLDIALCRITGSGRQSQVELVQFTTKPYGVEARKQLKKISSVEQVSLAEVCYQHTWLAGVHAGMILEALKEWEINPERVDCIASHGQTIYHLPARDQKDREQPDNSTLQMGDGDHIAVKTGILTISDFRQKHTAAGGEGAPMAGLVDEILFRDEVESRILLNIGGIANFTWLPVSAKSTRHSFTTDTGPGNTLIDALAQTYFQKPYDEDAHIARTGTVNKQLLRALLDDPWFSEENSKTTGPEYFSPGWLRDRCNVAGLAWNSLKPEDLIRTVTELSAATIAKSMSQIRIENNQKKPVIYASGGGAHNPLLVERISALLPDYPVKKMDELGINPDAKEAVLFAVLANEMLAGEGFLMQPGDGAGKRIQFGKISFPA